MNISPDGYPNFEVDENDLLNFEEFCDAKYKDPLVQKLGFFKVHLHKDVCRQTSIDDFLADFSGDAYRAVKETVILQDPAHCGLYGHHSLSVPNAFREQFMKSATTDSFVIQEAKYNCCLECLENEGVEAFLEHFFLYCETKALPISPKNKQRLGAINSKIRKWRAAHENRQLFQKQGSIEEKSRVLQLAIQSEKFDESHQAKECKFDPCEFMNLHIPHHADAPLGPLYSSGIEESFGKHVRLTRNFAMVHLCYKNMLSTLDSAFNGVSFPALYLGKCHSAFPIHVEDLSLWSFNFLLFGFPKFWIVIPPYAVDKLTDSLNRCGFGITHKTCRNVLGHKFFIPSVAWLTKEEIPFNVVIQREGEGMVLLPNAGHSGGNLGDNCAEACNFGTKSWIPYGCVYPFCSCLEDSIHVDLTQIVAVHRKDLLKAFMNNSVLSVVDDDYFLKSVVIPQRRQCVDIVSCTGPRETKPKIQCPVCPCTWATSIPRRNVMNHLTKYHKHNLGQDLVTSFLENKFPKGKKEK